MTTVSFSRDDCGAVVRRLWPYLDGRLPESDRAIVAEHLAGCTDCRSHFDFARAFLAAVHAIRPLEEESNADLRARIMGALASEGFIG